MSKRPPIHIHDLIEDLAREDGSYAIAYALLQLAEQAKRAARAIDRLGLADAATPMGAIEVLSIELKRIADAMESRGS